MGSPRPDAGLGPVDASDQPALDGGQDAGSDAGQPPLTADRCERIELTHTGEPSARDCRLELGIQLERYQYCTALVTLNDTELECEGPDGFRIIDGHVLQLLGAACQQLRTAEQAVVVARFPCNLPIP